MQLALRLISGSLGVGLLGAGAGIDLGALGPAGVASAEGGAALFRTLLGLHGLMLCAIGLRPAWLTAWSYRPLDDRDDEPAPLSHWLVLATLVVFAFLVRLIRIEAPLWLGEVLTLADSGRASLVLVLSGHTGAGQQMLYPLLMKAAMAVWGESAWAVRLPSVVFGALTPIAVYVLARRLTGSAPALAAAALLAFSYHHVWFSQNASGHAAALFFVLWSTHFWLLAQRRGGTATWAGYALTAAAGLWADLATVFVIGAQAAVWVAERLYGASGDNRWAAAPLAWGGAATLTGQLYAFALLALTGGSTGGSRPPDLSTPLWSGLAVAVRSMWEWLPTGLGWVTAVAVVTVVAVGWLGWSALLRQSGRAAWIVLWAALLAVAVSVLLGLSTSRAFFPLLGFGVIVAVLGIFELAARAAVFTGYVERTRRWAPVVLVGVIGLSALTVPGNYAQPKQDFPSAQAFVESEAQPGDARVSVGLAARAFESYFAPYWPNASSYEEFAAAREGAARTWVVYCMPDHLRAEHPRIAAAIEQDFELVATFRGTLPGGEIYVAREIASHDRRRVDPVPR